MNIEMLPVEIVGMKNDLQVVVQALRKLGCVHVDELSESMEVSARPLSLDRDTLRSQEELRFLKARLEGLLALLDKSGTQATVAPSGDYLEQAQTSIEKLLHEVQGLTTRREKLKAELATLPRYEATLRKLLPILPASARSPENACVGILVNRAYVGVLDSIGKRILEMTGGRAGIVASDVDLTTRAMLIVFPKDFSDQIETLLGREDVTRLRLPEELGEGPPDVMLETLQRRKASIPAEIGHIDRELARLSAQWNGRLAGWRDGLDDDIDGNSILSRFGETDMTFVLTGWLPAKDLEKVETALQEATQNKVLVHPLVMTPLLKRKAPVVLQNLPAARPYESLVKLLSLPRYGHIDPSGLMAIFLPIFFGMILGDIGYGLLLLLISLGGMRKFRKGMVRDLLILLAMGASWAMVFGFLYGELFGTLGEMLGMHPILFDRAGSEDVAGLLGMAIAVGAVHICLGLLLGIWEAAKDRSRNHLLDRGGMLVGLIGLFFLVGILAGVLPPGLMTPAIAGLIIGIVMLVASLGWLGILMGPIEFIGLIGNILSYLRIAAIGLASVYLAKVANDVAGMVGSVIVGTIIAIFLHALNLVLGAFSPTIHSLRLHYVEFFRKFYEGGGRPYEPYRSRFGTGSGS